MALKQPLTLDQARAIAQRIAIGRAKYRSQYSPPHSTAELSEALAVLEEHGNWDAPTKAELTKANRQLAACNARYARAKDKEQQQESYGVGEPGRDEVP